MSLAGWMNSWASLGAVVVGIRAQDFSLKLREYPDGWRTNFYPTGIAHSIVTESAWEPTPWGAVQRAA